MNCLLKKKIFHFPFKFLSSFLDHSQKFFILFSPKIPISKEILILKEITFFGHQQRKFHHLKIQRLFEVFLNAKPSKFFFSHLKERFQQLNEFNIKNDNKIRSLKNLNGGLLLFNMNDLPQ